MLIAVFRPSFFILPRLQFSCNCQMWITCKMRLLVFQSKQRPGRPNALSKFLNRCRAFHIDINCMTWNISKILQFYFKFRCSHCNHFQPVINSFLHHFQLMKTNETYIRFTPFTILYFLLFIKFIFYVHNFVHQIPVRMQD